MEDEEAIMAMLASSSVSGVLAEFSLVAVALFFEAEVGEGEVDVFGRLACFDFNLGVRLGFCGVAEGVADDGSVGVAVGVCFT